MVQYLHFRILKFPLIWQPSHGYGNQWKSPCLDRYINHWTEWSIFHSKLLVYWVLLEGIRLRDFVSTSPGAEKRWPNAMRRLLGEIIQLFFPTCQVRVVRFYHSCSPPPPPPPHPPPPSLLLPLLQLLLHHLCIHSHVHFRLANSSPSSSPTSARSVHCWTSTASVWAHWAPLDLNLGPSELTKHRWTSTSWDPPSSVSTAGPQPGTLRAQWAPLDFNG